MSVRTLLASVLASTAVLLGAASPAQAVEDVVEISTDGGASWTTEPSEALFADGIVLVPGDSTSATVLVRNGRTDAGRLSVDVVDVQTGSDDATYGFGIAAHDETGLSFARRAFDQVTTATRLLPSRVLDPGEVAEVTVVVDLSASLTARLAQGETVSFGLRITLTDDAVTTRPGEGCAGVCIEVPSGPSGPGAVEDRSAAGDVGQSASPGDPATSLGSSSAGDLPGTGVDIWWGTLVLALCLLAAGLLLERLGRRKRDPT